MSYRNDHAAALARIDALEAEIGILEREHARLSRVERERAAPAPRETAIIVLVLVFMAMIMLLDAYVRR